MRKELLLSLIAAGVMPTAALAAVDVTETSGINGVSNWENKGLGGAVFNGNLLDGTGSIVISTISAEVVYTTPATLPVGNYKITSAGTNYKVLVDGEETDKFTLTDEKKTVQIKLAKDDSGNDATITNLQLEIDIDFAAIKSELVDAMTGKTDLTAITAEGDYLVGLEENATALAERITAMNNLITLLDTEDLTTYQNEELGLYNEPSTVSETLKVLLADIVAHNENVADKNTRSANWKANQAQKADVEAAIKEAEDAVNALKLDEKSFVEETTKALVNDPDDGFTAFCEQIREVISSLDSDEKDMTDAENTTAVKAQLTAFQAQIEEAYKNDSLDYEAYILIPGYVKEVKDAYTLNYNLSMGYTGNYGSDLQTKISNYRTEAVGKLEAVEKVGAREAKIGSMTVEAYKDAAKAQLAKYIADAEVVKAAADDLVAADKSELDGYKTDIAALADDIAKLEPCAEKTRLEELAAAINGENGSIATTAQAIEDAYYEYYTTENAEDNIDTLLKDISDAIDALKRQVTAEAAAQADFIAVRDSLKGYKDTLNAEYGKLEAASAAINGLEGVSGVDLTESYKVAYNNVINAINAAEATNQAYFDDKTKPQVSDDALNDIKAGVEEFTAKAAPTAEEYSKALATYQALYDANQKIVDLVKDVKDYVLEGNGVVLTEADNRTDEIEAIKNKVVAAAGKTGDAVYSEVKAINDELAQPTALTVDKINAAYEQFALDLINGNKTVLDTKAAAYSTGFTADKYGPAVDKYGAEKDKDGLKQLLAKHQAEIDKVAAEMSWIAGNDYKKIIEDASQISSPFTQHGDQWGDDDKPFSNLIDGDQESFWHSIYTGHDDDPLDSQYVQFDLNGVYGNAKLCYARRKGGAGEAGRPTEFTIRGCNTADGEYVVLGTVAVSENEEFKVYDTEIDLKGYRYLRVSSSKSHGGKGWWHASELYFQAKNPAEKVALRLEENKNLVAVYNAMVEELDAMAETCLANVAAYKAIHETADNKYNEANILLNTGKAAVPAVGTEGEEGYVAAQPEVLNLEAWVKANDGDDNDRPAATYIASDAYKQLFAGTDDSWNDINTWIEAAYNNNECKATDRDVQLGNLLTSINNLKAAVTLNAENHAAALAQAELISVDHSINGYEGEQEVDDNGDPVYDEDGYAVWTVAPVKSLEDWVKDNAKDAALSTMLASDRYKAFGTGLEAVKNSIDRAFVATTVLANEQATEIAALKSALAKLKKDIIDNEDNYPTAKAQYTALDETITSAAALEAWITENSNEPATAAWKETTEYKALVPAYEEIVKAIDDAYASADVVVAADEESANITKLGQDWTAFSGRVAANETNHEEQLQNAEDAIAKVLKAIKDVDESGYSEDVTFVFNHDDDPVLVEEGGDDIEMTLADVKDALNGLQKDLTKLNKQVYDDYAALDSKEGNVYGELLATVNAYVTGIASDYYRAVKKANELTMETAMEGQKAGLDEAYKNAVALYNKVTNANGDINYNGYVAGLTDKISETYGHARLQKHYKTIRLLNQACQDILDAALPKLSETGAPVEGTTVADYTVLAETAFDGVKGGVATALADMNKYISDLTGSVDDYAAEFLNEQFAAKNADINEQEGIMETALMSDAQINEATLEAMNHLANAQAYVLVSDNAGAMPTFGYTDDVQSGSVDKYISTMKAALAELALSDVNTLEVLTNYWNAAYSAAETELAGYVARYEAAAPAALAEDVASAGEDLEDSQVNLPRIDDMVQNYLLGSPAGMVAEVIGKGIAAADIPAAMPILEYLVSQAKEAAETAEAMKAKNEANQTALAEYNRDVVPGVEAAVKEMHQVIGALGLSVDEFGEIKTEAADKELAVYKKMLVKEDGTDITNFNTVVNDINAQKDVVLNSVAVAYEKAYDLEKAYLNKLVTDIRADFNVKYEAGTLENADNLDKAIIAQVDAIAALPAEKNAAALTAMKEIEDALFAIDLGTIKPNTDATDVVKDALAAKAGEVDAAISELAAAVTELDGILKNEILAGWHRTPVAGIDTDGMTAELAAIKAAYEADNSVETKGSYYNDQLNELLNSVNTGKTNVATAKTDANNEISKRETSNALADALAEEIAAAQEAYNNILVDIEGYEKVSTDDYTTQMATINGEIVLDEDGNIISGGFIALAKAEIEKARAEFSLNATNTYRGQHYDTELDDVVDNDYMTHDLDYNLTRIYGSIDVLALKAANDEVRAWKREAQTELATARTAVNTGKHVGQADLVAELNRITTVLSGVNADFSEVTEYANNMMTAKGVIADAKALAALAEANEFTPGDFDGNDRVTTADFVTLMDIILGNVEEPEEDSVEFAAADLNEDGEIGIGDAVKEMRIINRVDNVPAASGAPRRSMVECSASLAQGQLNINNNISIASVMVDLKGASISDVTLAARAAGMDMFSNTLADGTLRVVILATDSSVLADNEGAVLNVGGKASVAKVVVADAAGREYMLVNNGEATAIETITNAIKNAGQKIYDMGGKLMNGLKKGVNIIRNADGSSTKVVNK